MMPWLGPWWGELVRCAQKGGKTGWDIIEAISSGHAEYWPMHDGALILQRTDDDGLLIWLGVGRGVRNWCGRAERDVAAFSKAIGCNRLVISGRKGWRRILPHWERDGEDLILRIAE